MRQGLLAMAAMAVAAPAMAQDMVGDAAAGEEHFNRQCVACHVVQDEAGEVLAGRNAKVGPNLYGVVGRTPGTYEGFDYSDLMVAYGETGAVWDESNMAPYLQDPTGFLREATGQDSGRSKMAFQVRQEQDAHDLYAYLATFSPEMAEEGAEGEAAEAEAD